MRIATLKSTIALLYLLAFMLGVSIAPGHAAAAPVTLTMTQNGGNVILDNSLIHATIETADARVVSMQYYGHEMVASTGRSHDIYFSMAGGKSYEQPSHCVFSITRQQPNGVDISCKRVYAPNDHQAWDIDVHYVLRQGVAGLYVYAILNHPATYPAVDMGEWRMVWWMPTLKGDYLMERIYVDEQRHWEMPSPYDLAHAQPTGIKEIVKLTTGPWAGRYDCKYAYSAEYQKVGTYGHASDRNQVGAWMVLGGYDYFNDGPDKQDLAPASGIIHLHLYRNHYGAPGFGIKQGQNWQKIYGPWLLYCNSGAPGDELWADAKAQVEKEKAQWPYVWVKQLLYPPAAERGTVTGKLTVHDALKPTLNAGGAWVGLALPEATAGNWQFQGADYQYWTRAGAAGSFSIPAVRPGHYTLYAFTDGAVGEFSQQNVEVKSGATTPLSNLTWNVPHHGSRIAWEIGIPNRSTTEFRHGGTGYWEPYLFTKFGVEFPNPLEYDVAQRNWATAWNYAQSAYSQGQANAPWKWRIHFNLDRVPTGDATLTIAYAGSHGAREEVYVNDAPRSLTTFAPPNQDGNALLRESNHAKYGVSYIPIPAARLKTGANTITLVQPSIKFAGNHIMYDYLNLELP